MANIAIIYYSSTGNAYKIAQAVEAGAQSVGAPTRLRKVRELAPAEAIASNKGWEQHIVATQHAAEAHLDDLEWADGFAFGASYAHGGQETTLMTVARYQGARLARYAHVLAENRAALSGK
jgi:NAD(P)H dehydrogenase (quinone)